MIKVTIVDDHIMILRGLKGMIDHESNIRVYGTYSTGEDLLDSLKKRATDIILLDINLPDYNGINLCEIIQTKYPEIRIIGVSNHDESIYIKQMMSKGAKGYLLKNTAKKEIIKAIKTVHSGDIYIADALKERMILEDIGVKKVEFVPNLTKRELEVLKFISEGLTNQEIANQLEISKRTIDIYRQNLLQKFEVKNAAHLIKKGFLYGFILE